MIGIDQPVELPANYDNLTPAKRKVVREAYVRLQEGKCWFCKTSLTGDPSPSVMARPVRKRLFPPAFFNYPVHLHHSHETGKTIGAVHAYCNAVLWEHYGE